MRISVEIWRSSAFLSFAELGTPVDSVSSKRDDFVLDCLALLNAVNGTESGHLPVERHSTQAVQLADEGQRDRMVDEVIAADAAAMEGEQMPVKAADNGDEIYGILDGVGVG